eukprot:TRINITY_DN3906_c0_g6_i1.p4 TRINITY_DN3906_c0_g6~~TRINITY_DN3906_c0_g6_i1.p4  ORF type:complete len:130 (-),score=3.62 TRINITY_DN3906_c0_g6_i1:5-394(-)
MYFVLSEWDHCRVHHLDASMHNRRFYRNQPVNIVLCFFFLCVFFFLQYPFDGKHPVFGQLRVCGKPWFRYYAVEFGSRMYFVLSEWDHCRVHHLDASMHNRRFYRNQPVNIVLCFFFLCAHVLCVDTTA